MKKFLLLSSLFFSVNVYAFDDLASMCAFNHINYKQAVLFVNKLKSELQKNDKQAVAALVAYPLTVNVTVKTNGKEASRQNIIKDKQQFLSEYPSIFTARLRADIVDDQDDIFCNYQGAMIARGTIWFKTENDEPAFFSVNIEPL